MIRQDYIQRAIEELARAVAALVGRSVPPEVTLQSVAEAKRHIPLTPGLIDILSVRDLVVRLDDQLVRDLATLLQLEGEAHLQLGNESLGTRSLRRSATLCSALTQSKTVVESNTL